VLDFNHLNRQTYGVYQMFKARTGLRPAPSIKRFEQAYLISLTALLLTTFLAGGICPLPLVREWLPKAFVASGSRAMLPLGALTVLFVGLLCLAAVCGAASVTLLVRAGKAAGRRGGVPEALGYLGIQTAAALFAIVSFRLYFATLATHYVEYHVLMYPRCFNSELDDTSGLDRWFGRVRRNWVIFYGTTLLVAGVVMVLRAAGSSPSLPMSYRAVVSIFDGLFVFHYFVEMLIWRFSNPFFRKALTSLYFTPRLRTSQ